MRYYIFILLSTLLFSNTPPTPVPYVDIKNFSGLWYEVARTYNRYQTECVASSVEYALEEDNTYKVLNLCFINVFVGYFIVYRVL